MSQVATTYTCKTTMFYTIFDFIMSVYAPTKINNVKQCNKILYKLFKLKRQKKHNYNSIFIHFYPF